MSQEMTDVTDALYAQVIHEAAGWATNGTFATVVANFDHKEDECFDEKFIMEVFRNYCKAMPKYSFNEYFKEEAADRLFDSAPNIDYNVCEQMSEYIKEHFPNMSARFEDEMTEDYCSLLSKARYHFTSYDVESYLKYKDYNFNIMLATPNEQNLDMVAICPFYKQALDFDNIESTDFNYSDNALTYLIHQQGHTAAELFTEAALYDKDECYYGSESRFIRSLRDELENYTYYTSELTVCFATRGENVLDIMNAIAHKTSNIQISKDTTVGLFDEWDGYDHGLEIMLDKPFIFPTNMIRNVQLQGANNNGYTVGEVSDGYWKTGEAKVTTDAVELQKEDLSALVETVKRDVKAYFDSIKSQAAQPKRFQKPLEHD